MVRRVALAIAGPITGFAMLVPLLVPATVHAAPCEAALIETYRRAWSDDAQLNQVKIAVRPNGYHKGGGTGDSVKSRDKLEDHIKGRRNVDVGPGRIQGMENLVFTIIEHVLMRDVCIVHWRGTGDHTRIDDAGNADPHTGVVLEGVTALKIVGGKIQSEEILTSNDDDVLQILGYK